MLRVVLDTNVIISGVISPHGPPPQIFKAWHQQKFELLVSEALLLEVSRVFHYPRLQKAYRLSEADIQVVLDSLNEAGKRMMDFPEEVRVKASQLEQQMTEAANAGNRDEFLSCLWQWRRCFH